MSELRTMSWDPADRISSQWILNNWQLPQARCQSIGFTPLAYGICRSETTLRWNPQSLNDQAPPEQVAESSAQMPGLKQTSFTSHSFRPHGLGMFGCLCCQTGKIEAQEAWRMDTAQLHEVRYSFALPQSWPNELWKLLPGVCWDLVALIQTEFLPVSRQKKFSKTVTRRNTECSSSAAHLAKERRSTAAPSAPFVRASKHLQNRENSVCF